MNVHIFLSMSNLFLGVVPFMNAMFVNDTVAAVVIVATMLASTAMHLSDSKGGRRPLMWGDYSTLFINIDRIVACSALMWGLHRIWTLNIDITIIQWWIIAVGFICNGMSELITDPFGHAITHAVWHLSTYVGLNSVIV